jgi:glycosyltransferase involved in cell wall biosynthesis
MMKFSVIMPAYNSAETIQTAIDSVVAQIHADWELIVVDDQSSDGTESIVRKRQRQDGRIRLVRNTTNLGVARSRNRGIDLVTGEVIAFLDADDVWDPDKLAIQATALADRAVDLVASNYRAHKGDLVTIRRRPARTYQYEEMLRSGNPVGLLTAAVRRQALGTLRFQARRHEDYRLWLDLAFRGSKIMLLPDVLATYRISETSVSGNKLKSAWWTFRVFLDQPQVSLAKALRFEFGYLLNVFLRRR